MRYRASWELTSILMQNWRAIVPGSAFRYVAVGAANTIVGYAIIWGAMYGLSMAPIPANLFGYSVGFVVSFILNRRFTFRSRVRTVSAAPRFAAVTVVAYLSNLGTVAALLSIPRFDAYLAQICGLAPYMIVGYLGSRYFVFNDSNVEARHSEKQQ